jgi:hypothetical protein
MRVCNSVCNQIPVTPSQEQLCAYMHYGPVLFASPMGVNGLLELSLLQNPIAMHAGDIVPSNSCSIWPNLLQSKSNGSSSEYVPRKIAADRSEVVKRGQAAPRTCTY